jgi:hypothetical protein
MRMSLGLLNVMRWSLNSVGTNKHGWCLTNQHDICIVVVSDGHKCGCECHGMEVTQ